MTARLASVLATVSLLVAGCGGDRWVRVFDAHADSADATVLTIGLGICRQPAPAEFPTVIESSTEVRIRISMKHGDGAEASCEAGLNISLKSPIGHRVVIDDRTGRRIEVVLFH
jgi:hypothetical protein